MPIVGFFKDLDEVHKLTQPMLLSGVVEEIIKVGGIMPKLPIEVVRGKSLKYNREKSLPAGGFYDVHEAIPWTSTVEFTVPMEVELKRIIFNAMLDRFVHTYENINDYEAIMVSLIAKGLAQTLEQTLVYGTDATQGLGTKAFSGLWQLCDSAMRIKNHGTGGPLSLSKLRLLLDTVKFRPDMLLMPFSVASRIDAAYQEAGISSFVGPGRISWANNEAGQRVTLFDSIPILRSDFMKMTEGDSSPYDGAQANGSIFAIHFGRIAEGGVSLLLSEQGAGAGAAGFFKVVKLDELEDYDASGIRFVLYVALAVGSTKALGHLCNITDAAVIA